MNSAQALNHLDKGIISFTNQPLRNFVEQTMENYFQHIDPLLPPTHLYQLVLEEVEQPLFKAVLKFTKNNQCKAALMLGISRSTLRKKLKLYGLE